MPGRNRRRPSPRFGAHDQSTVLRWLELIPTGSVRDAASMPTKILAMLGKESRALTSKPTRTTERLAKAAFALFDQRGYEQTARGQHRRAGQLVQSSPPSAEATPMRSPIFTENDRVAITARSLNGDIHVAKTSSKSPSSVGNGPITMGSKKR
jgi:hypothetical protein